GCRWLIARWRGLAEALAETPTWEASDKTLAFQLLGKRPTDLFLDPVAKELTAAHLAAVVGNVNPSLDQIRGWLLPQRPEGMSAGEFDRRVQRLIPQFPDRDQGRAILVECVQGALAELEEHLELVEAREERDRLLAVQRAAFDSSKEGASRLRYE